MASESPGKLDELQAFGFSKEEIYTPVISRRTRAREGNIRAAFGREDGQGTRLERIAEHADPVFASRDKALRWLRSEIIAFRGS